MPYFCNFRRIILPKTVNRFRRNLHGYKAIADFFLSIYSYSMLKKIISGYAQILSSVSKVLILLALCIGLGAAFVYPLWYFATTFPHTYSFLLLAIAGGVFLFWIFKRIKKLGLKAFFFFLAKFLLVVLTAFIFVFLVFDGKRFFTIPLVIVSLLLYGLLALYSKNSVQKNDGALVDDE